LEKWITLQESDVYQVSNLGRIKSVSRVIIEKDKTPYFKKEKILKNKITSNGYCQVALYYNKKYNYFYVHRLVAKYFIGSIENKEVNHKDANKKNNNIENLELVSKKENTKHAKNNKLYKNGENHGLTFLTQADIKNIIDLYNNGMSNKEIALIYKLTTKYVWSITAKKTWKYMEEKNV